MRARVGPGARAAGVARRVPAPNGRGLSHKNVYNVDLQKSIPKTFGQLILHICNSKENVDGFVGELTFAKRL